MRIGLNMLFLAPGLTGGIETYARGLLHALDKEAPADYEFVVFLSRQAAATFENLSARVTLHAVDARLEIRTRKNVYEQIILPWLVLKHKIDLLHSLAYTGPVLAPVPQVLTIPDLNFKFPGHAVRGMKRVALNILSWAAATRSRKIIAISNFTKQEIQKYWPAIAIKTNVVHLGSEPAPARRAGKSQARSGFLLFVGGGAHKNSAAAVRAYGQTNADLDWDLILVGRMDKELARELSQMTLRKRERVKAVGFQSRMALDELIFSAGCLLVPSRYEGFGLPVLEAQVRGIPVITSHAASLAEIAGEGALLFDPDKEEQLVGLMNQVASSNTLCDKLIERGYENARRFSWSRTAKETIIIYGEVLRKEAHALH